MLFGLYDAVVRPVDVTLAEFSDMVECAGRGDPGFEIGKFVLGSTVAETAVGGAGSAGGFGEDEVIGIWGGVATDA